MHDYRLGDNVNFYLGTGQHIEGIIEDFEESKNYFIIFVCKDGKTIPCVLDKKNNSVVRL